MLFQVELSLTLEAILNASCINTLKRWRKGLSKLRRAFVKCFEGGANRSKVDQEPIKKTASNKTKDEIENGNSKKNDDAASNRTEDKTENGNSKKDDEDAEDDEERAREAEEEAKEALRKVT